MLKGEQAEPYLTPSRERRLVCQLCAPRAQQEGWIREAAAPEMPARPQRPPERRGLLRRRRAGGEAGRRAGSAPLPVEPAPDERHGRAPRTTTRSRARLLGAPVAAAQPAPRDGRADERAAEDRPGARAVQRLRASAHGGGHRPHARDPAGVRVDLEVVGRRGAADRRLGAVLVPVRRRPLGRPRAGAAARPGPGAVRAAPEAQDWNCTVEANGRIELGTDPTGRRRTSRRMRPPAEPLRQDGAQSTGESGKRPL